MLHRKIKIRFTIILVSVRFKSCNIYVCVCVYDVGIATALRIRTLGV
jgi:hypothetical protein